MINNVMSAGLQGVRNGTLGMQDAANRIAQNGAAQPQQLTSGSAENVQAGESTGGFAEPIIDLKLNQRGVEASLEVVKAADETLGTLLDENA